VNSRLNRRGVFLPENDTVVWSQENKREGGAGKFFFFSKGPDVRRSLLLNTTFAELKGTLHSRGGRRKM